MTADPFEGVPAEGQAQTDPLTGEPVAPPAPPEGEGLGGFNPSEEEAAAPAGDTAEAAPAQESEPEPAAAPVAPEPEPEQPGSSPEPTPEPAPPAAAEAEPEKPKRGRKPKASTDKAPTSRGYVLLKAMGSDGKYQRLTVGGKDVIEARSGEYAMRTYAASVGEIDEKIVAIPLSVFAEQRVKTTTEQKVAVKIG